MAISGLQEVKNFSRAFPKRDKQMPVLFVGHGSPMNGIDDNMFSQRWSQLGNEIPWPNAVLCISAHWLTHGTHVTSMEAPKTIHDFGGFPKALYEVEYPAPGSLALAETTKELLTKTVVSLDHEWGLDHGCWTITRRMFPEANIPIVQLSIAFEKSARFHYELGEELKALRDRGILILGSGNMIHNLRMVAWDKMEVPGYGYDWALEMNETFKKSITENRHADLIQYQKWGEAALMSIPTPDHYYPLLYTLGALEKGETIKFFNDQCVAGSLSMTSIISQ